MSASHPVRTAIIGIGEVPTGWRPERSCIELAVEAVKAALDDAGVRKQDVGAFFLAPPLARERDEYHLTFCRLQEEMGIHGGAAKLNMQISSWGASPILAIETAGAMIECGEIEFAIIYNAQNFSGASEQDHRWFFERNNRGFFREWERHLGISKESMTALVATRYMHETKTSEAELAAVTVSLRKWAAQNEFARFSEPLGASDVLSNEVAATPVRSLEFGALSDGATALVLTSAELAQSVTGRKPVFVLGAGHSGAPRLSAVQKPGGDLTRLGFGEAARAALAQARLTLDDIDLFELYATHPIYYIMQLEEMGLCERGEAGALFARSEMAPGGKYPVATNGGVQQGDTGLGMAMTSITECVRQLRNQAGRRQVRQAKHALVSGFGNQMADAHALVLGVGADT